MVSDSKKDKMTYVRFNIARFASYTRAPERGARISISGRRAFKRFNSFGGAAAVSLLIAASVAVAEPKPVTRSAEQRIKSGKVVDQLSGLEAARAGERVSRSELRRAKDDRDASVRRKAIQVLAAEGETTVTADLINSLAQDPDAAVRQTAAEELGNFVQSAGVVAALSRALSQDPAAAVRYASARSLALSRTAEAIEALARAAQEADPNLRRQIAVGLGRHSSPQANSILKKLERDANASVREAAKGGPR